MNNTIELLFASHSKHKTAEIIGLLPKHVVIKNLHDIGYSEEIDELGKTLEENALIKLRQIVRLYNTNTFSEDTGLEVFALHMEPGLHTARYAGPQRNNEDNIAKLLANLKGVENRRAQFRTVIALWYDGKEYMFEAKVLGRIARQASGTGGFGYDPIFIPDGHDSSFAELSLEVKNTISHRARALGLLLQFLNNAS